MNALHLSYFHESVSDDRSDSCTITIFRFQKSKMLGFVTFLFLASLLTTSTALAFYSKTGDVVQLTEMNSVLKDNSIWLVEFFAPWYVT